MSAYRSACLLTIIIASPAMAAAPDGNVEWAGVSHIAFHDRAPLCPMGGETFNLRFQAWRNDLTGARVRIDDGAISFAAATLIASRGPYDIWQATVPATASNTMSYVLELQDGADIDYYDSFGSTENIRLTAQFALDFTTLDHAPIGATPVAGGTVFKVWTRTATTCHVRGTFNAWGLSNTLTRVGEHFIGFIPGTVPGDQYKYFFNNSVWKPDPRGRRLNAGDNQNTFIIDPLAYQWQVNDFSPPPLEDMVIYQLHVGSFAGRNDPMGPTANPSTYRDVGERVGHLVELGVNVVMINPIQEFPGDFSGGYDPITQYAPDWKLGTPDDLKWMIDQFHANGIALLLDIVWNHVAASDNFLWNFDGTQLYFDSPAIDTPWGAQADFGKTGVRSWYLDSIVNWLDEYRFDGFRVDATSFMDIQSGGWSLMQAMNNLMDNRYADKVNIAEQLPDNPWVTRPVTLGGAGFDSQYWDAFTDQLRAQGIFAMAFGDPEMWRMNNMINGGGQFLTGEQVLNYFELHDEAWPLSGGQRAVKTIDPTAPHDDQFARSRTMLAQGFTMLAPGVPAFLMGTEWLESAGFETEKLDWSKKTTYADVFSYYQQLVGLRAGNSALRANSPHQVTHINETGNVIAWQRFNLNGLVYLIVANFSNIDYTDYRIGLPFEGSWTEVLNSQDAAFGGNGFVNPISIQTEPIAADGLLQSALIKVPRSGIVVLQLDIVSAPCPGDANADGQVNFSDITDVLANWLSDGSTGGDANADGLVNFADITAVLSNWLAACP